MDIRTQVPTCFGDWNEKFGATWKKQITEFQAKFGDAIAEVRMPGEFPTDVPILYVSKDKIVAVLEFMKSAPGFEYNFLADLTATDEEVEPRFEVVYNLLARQHMWRIRLKVRLNEGQEVATATTVWPVANWLEREVWDMYGVKFTGHPNLKRILMDERWVGHPLRKDYPIRGYQIFPTTQEVHPNELE